MKRWTAGQTQKEVKSEVALEDLNSTSEIHCLKLVGDVLGIGEGPLIRTFFWIQGPSPRSVGQGFGTENLEGPDYRTFQVTTDFYTQFLVFLGFKKNCKVPVKRALRYP